MTTEKKMSFTINIDHVLDLITNSSSELFVIDAGMTKETLVEMVNEQLKGFSSINIHNIEERFSRDESPEDFQWKMDELLNCLDETDSAEIKEKYFTKPKFYGISFDRDYIYRSNIDVRAKLCEIGFEFETGDY